MFFISGFAGLLPVVSWVFGCKWLIINGIHFCRLDVFCWWFLSEHDFWILRFTGCGLLYGCCGFVVILGLLIISSIAGFLPVFSWVLIDKSLIINAIHFSSLHAIAGGFLS